MAAKGRIFVAIPAHAIAACHDHLILNGARSQQGLPVIHAPGRPLRWNDGDHGSLQRVMSKELRETEIVAHSQRCPAPGQVKDGHGVARLEVLMFVHQAKKMSLAVMAPQDAFGVVDDGRVKKPIALTLQKRARQVDTVGFGQGSHLGKETRA
jgi:hypothetical protein